MKITKQHVLNDALSAAIEIRNQGKAEITGFMHSFSNCNSFELNIHVPTWELDKTGFKFEIHLGDGYQKSNSEALAKLRVYADCGFDNDPEIIKRKANAIAEKKALLKKLQKELQETV